MPYLLVVTPYDPSLPGVRSLYFSDAGFVTEPGDVPSNTYFVRRIGAPLSITRALFSGTDVGGQSSIALGTIILANDDGAYDFLGDYDWSGRFVELGYTAKTTPVLADFEVLFTGTAETITLGVQDLTINLRDLQVLFDQPFQPTATYGGTGGADGTSDLTGRRKPWLGGISRQVAPILIDAANLIYQINSGPISSVLAARDKGAAFSAPGADCANYAALVAASMTGFDYRTSLATGLIRLTSKPLGQFTVDVEGQTAAGVWVNCFADLVSVIATTMTSLTAADLNAASFAAMKTLCPQVLGYWYDGSGSQTVHQVIDALAESVGAWWGFDSTRKLVIGRYDAPAAMADFSFGDRDISDITPQQTVRRLWRQTIQYREYSTVLSGGTDVAGSVSDADRVDFAQQWRSQVFADPTVQTASLLATDETVPTCLDDPADALAEATRRVGFHGPLRASHSVTVPLTPGLDVNATVNLTTARFGLVAGKNFRVLQAQRDAVNELHILTVIG